MPTIIPKTYYCPKCKKEINKKRCDCGSKTKPVAPYTVRFRWINQDGMEEHKRLTGTPPWMTQSAAQKGYEKWVFEHPTNSSASTKCIEFLPLYEEFKQFLKNNVKESSYIAYCQRLDNFVLPKFKDTTVTKIKPADIIKWQNSLTVEGYSFKYKKSIREAFNLFFNYLKIYDIPNPFEKVKGFRALNEKKKEMLYWTEDEFALFITEVDDLLYKALFSFLYFTGCRKGEALALHWSDLENNIIRFNKTLSVKTLDKAYKETTPKTENSYRTVIIPDGLVALLNQLKQNTTGNYIFGGVKHLPFQTVTNRFIGYTKKAKVKQIRIHDLRHSHASFLINHGDNQLSTLYIIAQRLGDTPEMVLKTYGHLFPNNNEDMLKNINDFFNSCA